MSEIREQLRQIKEKRDLSLAELSRAMNVSSSALSQWMNETYKGDNNRIEEAVKAYLAREEARSRAPKVEIGFLETSVFTEFLAMCASCHNDGLIGVFTAPPGLGKTEACKEYIRRYPDSILIEANLGLREWKLFCNLSKSLGLTHQGSGVQDLFEGVVSKLQDSGRLIIVDEAEYLPYRSLELLRRVHDMAGVGIVLAGLPRLIENLKGKRNEYAQLYSRVGWWGRVKGLTPDDARMIVERAVPEASARLTKLFHETSRGNARHLSMLLRRSVEMASANDMEVNPEVVQRAAEMIII